MAWLPYVYQYAFMIAFFSLGLVLCWRQGEVGFKSPRTLRNLAMLVGGLLFYMALQGVFQFLGPPTPAAAQGTVYDRFFVRSFHPLGAPAEQDGSWKQRMTVEGAWFYGFDGRKQTTYLLEQDLDSGPPGEAFTKICPVFDAPLTDWHPSILEPFVERGFRFSEVQRKHCLPACLDFEPADVEACQDRCVTVCRAHRMLIFHGQVL